MDQHRRAASHQVIFIYKHFRNSLWVWWIIHKHLQVYRQTTTNTRRAYLTNMPRSIMNDKRKFASLLSLANLEVRLHSVFTNAGIHLYRTLFVYFFLCAFPMNKLQHKRDVSLLHTDSALIIIDEHLAMSTTSVHKVLSEREGGFCCYSINFCF